MGLVAASVGAGLVKGVDKSISDSDILSKHCGSLDPKIETVREELHAFEDEMNDWEKLLYTIISVPVYYFTRAFFWPFLITYICFSMARRK